jgi:hypothetical protein
MDILGDLLDALDGRWTRWWVAVGAAALAFGEIAVLVTGTWPNIGSAPHTSASLA